MTTTEMSPPRPKAERDAPGVHIVGVDVSLGDLMTLCFKASIAMIPVALFWAIVYFVIAAMIRNANP